MIIVGRTLGMVGGVALLVWVLLVYGFWLGLLPDTWFEPLGQFGSVIFLFVVPILCVAALGISNRIVDASHHGAGFTRVATAPKPAIKFSKRLENISKSSIGPLLLVGLALLGWWFGLLCELLTLCLVIGLGVYVVLLIRMYWEDRQEVPLRRKILLTIGWFYLFISVNLLMLGEPRDSGGWVYPLHVIGALVIAIFYPLVWLYRMFFGST